jgi:hypothetical protein
VTGPTVLPDCPDDTRPREVASYLWEEYRYRHDMVWKLAFRVTAVAAALLIAPFLADESVRRNVTWALVFLPVLAIVVILGGMFVLQSELGHLDHIKNAYRCAQNDALNYLPQPDCWTPHPLVPKPSRLRLLSWLRSVKFGERVYAYLTALLLLALIYVGLFVGVWYDKLLNGH